MQSVHFYCFCETTFAEPIELYRWDFFANFCARLKRCSSSGQNQIRAGRPSELCRVLAANPLRRSGSRGSASCTTLLVHIWRDCINLHNHGCWFPALARVRMWKVSYHDVCNNPKWSWRSRKTFNHGRLSIFQQGFSSSERVPLGLHNRFASFFPAKSPN